MSDYDHYMKESMNIALDERSLYLRGLVLRSIKNAGRGHVGSSLSLIEILRVLYDDVLSINPDRCHDPNRDRSILSKGHGCLALYAILADKGYFSIDDLDTFCAYDSFLGGHPEYGKIPGVEASTGALGHGLSIAVGIALAGKMQSKQYKTFVTMGDGEINEGSVWEAAMSAAKHQLGHLFAIIDYNKLQSYAYTNEVLPLEPLADKWRAFGFVVHEINGHDLNELRKVFAKQVELNSSPTAVICHTIKGKGLPIAELNAAWHHKNKLSETELDLIKSVYGNI